jgi:hypothetical protein
MSKIRQTPQTLRPRRGTAKTTRRSQANPRPRPGLPAGQALASRLRLPRGRFRPRCCPNRACPFHQPRTDWKFIRFGFYQLRGHPRPLQRFRCLHCRRTFTPRTFAVTYWLHRDDLFALIAQLSTAGSGLRQIARVLRISHTTVARHLARAGRHCLIFHRQMLQGTSLGETLAFDGFESFEYSQFFPFHLNLAVGRESWFIYHFTDSPLRRKGSMTPVQRRRREEIEASLGRPDPQAVESGVLELLLVALGARPKDPPETIILESDQHPAYVRAVRSLRARAGVPPIRHRRTSSLKPRTTANPLFPANLVDLLLRHCGANHRRETIAFSKRRQGALERAALFTVWRNAIKWRREKKPGETAAMHAGFLRERLSWPQLFGRRLFPRRRELPGCWWAYYWRRVKTAALGPGQAEHGLKYAF